MTKKQSITYPIPASLTKPSRDWLRWLQSEFVLERHHYLLAVKAAEALDRGDLAQAAIKKHGLTYTDQHGNPHTRPEARIVESAATTFRQMLREMGLDVVDAALPHPPSMRGHSHLRNGSR